MSFLSPAWLAGLALLPLLWWLHRTSSRGRSVQVSSLLLWPAEAGAPRARNAQIRELDLAWLRRAAALAALSFGLAGPRFTVATAPLIVWLDGAASLETVEDGSTRIERALRELTVRVGERRGGEVLFRSLADPAFADYARAPFGAIARRRPIGAPELPPRASLDPHAEHWVVTDGATAAVNEWIGRMPVAAVVRVGEATENVALIGLAARPALGERDRLDVEVRVRNAGRLAAKRTVRLEGAGGARVSVEIEIPAATTATLRMDLDGGALPLAARLTPADALERDDVLGLPATPLRVPVAVDPDCGVALRAALIAHPRLAPSRPGAEDALRVDCGPHRDSVAGVHLRVRRDGPSRRVAQPAAWLEP